MVEIKNTISSQRLSASVSNIIREGVPAVGGLKFSMAQKKVQKSASWGKCQLGEVPVGGSASWGTRASWGTKFNPWTDDFFQIL